MKPIIVIHQHRPWQRWFIIAASVGIVALSGWLFYSHVRATTISDFAHAQSERDRLRAENQRLERELREARSAAQSARDDAAYATRSAEIDQDACQQVKASLAGLQSESADLREQLAFYRGIVEPESANGGVRVYDFKLTRGKVASSYHFDLVLIQSVHHDKRIAGKLDIAVDGLTRGQHQTLKLAELSAGDAQNLLFSFKYFQEFSGDLHLPDGFRPLRATVSVMPEGGGPAAVEEPYDWSRIERKPEN